MGDDVFFFGCWSGVGHHMYRPDGSTVSAAACHKIFGPGWQAVDGGNALYPETRGVWAWGITRFGDSPWDFLSSQDHTVDVRTGAHATFLMRIHPYTSPRTHTQMMEMVCNAFPQIARRVGLVADLEAHYDRAAEHNAKQRKQANMRSITAHQKNECNRNITIVADERNPEHGNASHVYELTPTLDQPVPGSGVRFENVTIEFQNGPIKEVGTNGITDEALLAIVADRLEGFQSSKYACRENALALTKIQEALHWLEHRTRAREARGVEGTHEV